MQPLVRDNIRLAATVMLLRDTPGGLEVYMVQRPGRGDFPDLHVFPGGKVDEDDWAPQHCFGIDDQQASARLGVAAGGLRYWVAVARECFEECGVLIVHQNGKPLDLSQTQVREKFANYRQQLLVGEISFSSLCKEENLTVACDRLAYFSHWITPPVVPRRFDTRFFLAALPDHQIALADTDETADDQWEKPSEALARSATKQWQMIDPTLRSLETLSQFSTVSQALAEVKQGDHLMPLTPELNRQGMQALRQNMTNTVIIKDLNKSYQDGQQRIDVLRGLNLELPVGQTLAVMGPSGSGKSTLLNIIAGLVSVDSGAVNVHLNNQFYALHQLDERARTQLRRSCMGYVYQFFNLVPTLTVVENVSLPARLNRRNDLDLRARELLAAFGLKDRHQAFPEVLSGGEQQRVAVARALLLEPPLLLADEPTGNLDAANADQVASLLFDNARALGLTVIVATHSEEVANRADQCLHMHDLNQRGS